MPHAQKVGRAIPFGYVPNCLGKDLYTKKNQGVKFAENSENSEIPALRFLTIFLKPNIRKLVKHFFFLNSKIRIFEAHIIRFSENFYGEILRKKTMSRGQNILYSYK